MALNESSPPFMLTTRFSVVPMSMRERRRVEAVEAHARAVGGGGEDLGAVAAVDLGGVGAGAAFDQVGVVARVPDHAVVAALAEHLVVGVAAGQHVVARAAEQEVEAALAEQRVVAALAEQQVVARAAGQHVVAGAAEQVGARQRAVGLVERDDVVAALAEHLDQRGVGDRRRAAGDGDRAAVDQDLAGGVAADDDGVVEGVAEDGQQARARNERGGDGLDEDIVVASVRQEDLVAQQDFSFRLLHFKLSESASGCFQETPVACTRCIPRVQAS